MKTHLNPTESLTVVIDGAEITLTAQQLLQLKQAETTDPDEKYRELCNELIPTYHVTKHVLTYLSWQRVNSYIKMLNIAAKLNGEADWNGFGYYITNFSGLITSKTVSEDYIDGCVKFQSEALAIEALAYLNSEDKIAMFGTHKVKE